MIDRPHHQPQQAMGSSTWAMRPRLQAGEIVEGSVIAEITPYPCRLRPLHPINAIHLADGFPPEQVDSYDSYLEAHYTPPEAQFVLAVVEYPSGPIARWGRLHWSKVEIILQSAGRWAIPSAPGALLPGGEPAETAELRRLVEELAQQALYQGWEPAGRGRAWCSLRFRQPYAYLRGALRWK